MIKCPEGFKFSSVKANIKYKNRDDLALILVDNSAEVIGFFTKNRIKAAPVIYCQKILKKNSKIKAILINSGNANACTGIEGFKDCKEIAKFLKKYLKLKEDEILISSTGVIGVKLPVQNILNKIPNLIKKADKKNFHKVAEAIMTTDTFPKTAIFANDKFTIAGIAKGAGMINPNMATMLAYILTDIPFKDNYEKLFRKIVDETFNSICVDGDTSTNDTVLFISTGLNKNKISKQEIEKAFYTVCLELAKKIVQDGEGATKFITIEIEGGKTELQCKKLGEVLSKSVLVKTAFFGNDPNWGRIVCALGYGDKSIVPDKIEIKLGDILIFKNGKEAENFSEEKAYNYLKNNKNILLKINLNLGDKKWRYYTCDLSYDYVKINAEYRT